MEEDNPCNTRRPANGKSSVVLIIVFAVIFVGIIVTCVNYVAVLAGNKDEKIMKTRIHETFVPKAVSHVVSLMTDNQRFRRNATRLAQRFPYVVAVTRNSSRVWRFACFASVVLMKWIVISAHCR